LTDAKSDELKQMNAGQALGFLAGLFITFLVVIPAGIVLGLFLIITQRIVAWTL
jgi:hypothetical protein